MRASKRIDGMNIELTTYCPLHCPQCYCSREGGKMIPREIAQKYIQEAAALGVSHIELSGGETMCYPFLTDLIEEASAYRISTSIAISGWNFDDVSLKKLMAAGIDSIFVSLNGPTREINQLTRDGYEYAINALKVLQRNHFPNTIINWVMHRKSVPYLEEMIALAEQYDVQAILILEPKPTSNGELSTYPSRDQMYQVADRVKHQKGNVELIIQHCFSPLLALSCDNLLWGNRNRGPYKGCTAGSYSITVNVDGNFSPCRHLYYSEKWDSINQYLDESPVLKKITEIQKTKWGECVGCRLSNYCVRCVSLYGKIFTEHNMERTRCMIYEKTIV